LHEKDNDFSLTVYNTVYHKSTLVGVKENKVCTVFTVTHTVDEK